MKWNRPNKALFEPRAPRVNLQGIVSATIHLENGRQLTGKLRTLSVTGGLLDVAVCLDERTEISLMFRFGPRHTSNRRRNCCFQCEAAWDICSRSVSPRSA